VASGRKYLDSTVTSTVIGGFNRHRHRSVPPDASDGLTEREKEVLRLVAWGHSNKEIGAQLNVSVKTVETHKSHAMEKLGLRHRTDVVRFALLRGWLDVA
jgi:two-component system response regulator NreC